MGHACLMGEKSQGLLANVSDGIITYPMIGPSPISEIILKGNKIIHMKNRKYPPCLPVIPICDECSICPSLSFGFPPSLLEAPGVIVNFISLFNEILPSS